ncbi:hypothetical protein PAMP_023527 [Pampus punctatissimus]
MDVIFKEGMLYLQGVKFGKRTWRKMWMVVFKPSSSGVGRLELYNIIDSYAAIDQKKPGRLKTPERKVVRLSDCLSITPAPKESCPSGCTAFYLNTTQCTYTLASMTSQDWLSALCLLAFQKDPGESDKGNDLTMEDNDLYSSWKSDLTLPPNQYQVTVQSTEASRRCKLIGEYLISPDSEAVLLLAIKTGRIIYNWPYRLLRKFGKVEGGFSIEAGRRCDSGEGVFIFLSRNGSQIFQAISRQCSVEKKSSVQPVSVQRCSLRDQPLLKSSTTTTTRAADYTDYSPKDAHTEDESDNHYSTISSASMFNVKQLSLYPDLNTSKEALVEESKDKDKDKDEDEDEDEAEAKAKAEDEDKAEAEDEDEDEDERFHSLEAANLDNVIDDSIYYNLSRATPPMSRKDLVKPEIQSSECIYSDLKMVQPPLDPQAQSYSSPSLPPVPEPPPPCALPQAAPYTPPKQRYQRQPSPSNYTQPGYSAQTQSEDDVTETEEAISVNPTETPGSFKHRLAEIISKDLAKFQLPFPPGLGPPTFPQ